MKINDLISKLNKEQILRFLLNSKTLIICGMLFLSIIVFSICSKSNGKISTEVNDFDNTSFDAVDFDIATTDDDVEIIYNNAPVNSNSNSSAMRDTTILIEDTGRADPFLPESEINSLANINKPRPSYDLLPPPEIITNDTTATEVMTTKVSGLMYDKISPSAIININNNDYLVRKGDVVNDYTVLDIDKKSVTVKYGANIYKAGVGELFTGQGINYNTISNLERKFGGAENSVNKK